MFFILEGTRGAGDGAGPLLNGDFAGFLLKIRAQRNTEFYATDLPIRLARRGC